jgi:lysyl-tRNA synthetase class 2
MSSIIHILPDEISQDDIDDLKKRYDRVREYIWQKDYKNLISLSQVLETFIRFIETGKSLCIYGRVIKVDDFGKLIFAELQDEFRSIELKLSFNINPLPFDIWKQYVKLGDWIVVSGQASYSRDGDPQIEVHDLSFLSLCGLLPNYSGISEHALSSKRASRFVHTQMISNPKEVAASKARSTALLAIREFLADENFDEQITPILTNSFHGGGSHPFTTYSRHENRDLYLRLTAEIAIKMLIAGGLSRVYEIGPSFRNETTDSLHMLGFTLLEAYAVCVTFDEMIELLERMIIRVFSDVKNVWGGDELPHLNLEFQKFDRIPAKYAISKFVGVDFTLAEGIAKLAKLVGAEFPKNDEETTKLIYRAVEKLVYPSITRPTFLTELPAGISPLIQENPQDSTTLQRAFLVWNGIQFGEVFSSKLDAVSITEDIMKQTVDWKSMSGIVNRDYRNFLHAMFCGIPPTSVMDVGIERLFMLLLGKKDIRTLLIDI